MSIPVKQSVWRVLSEMTELGTGSWNEDMANEGKCGKIQGSKIFGCGCSRHVKLHFSCMSHVNTPARRLWSSHVEYIKLSIRIIG